MSPIEQIARGSGWTIAARWSVRGIGLVSTIILARVLEPTDFGIVAMGTAAVGFVSVFSQAGQNQAVIRHVNPTAAHFDTAWTMSVCGGLIVAVVLFALAPLAAWYFHDPRVVPVVRFLALAPLIDGFANVGAVAGFQRALLFHKDFALVVVRKISSFAITVGLALAVRNYWALAVGIVCGEALAVLASYRMDPYRPRLRLSKLREMWSYSVWMQFSAIGEFLGGRTDQILVGGLAGTAQMGSYNVAEDLASAPTGEVVLPILRTVFPVYSTMLQEPQRLAETYLGVLSITAAVALAAGAGVALVADDMVALLLGAKWASAALLIPWLAVGAGLLGITRGVNEVLNVTGNARMNAFQVWCFVAVLAPTALVGGLTWGAEGVAAARMGVTIIFIPIMFLLLMRVIPVKAGQIIACLWRPGLAAVAMAAILSFASTTVSSSIALRLFCNVGFGAIVFATTLLALWYIAGRPKGVERLMLEVSGRVVKRLMTDIALGPQTIRRLISRPAGRRG